MIEPTLHDIIQLGSVLLAQVHSGMIQMKCDICETDPSISKELNCTMEDNDNIIYSHEDIGELYCCPLKCISADVLSFYDKYQYYKMFPGAAPSYEEADVNFYFFCKTYEGHKNKYELENMDQNSKVNKEKKSQGNMALLRGSFLGKNKG